MTEKKKGNLWFLWEPQSKLQIILTPVQLVFNRQYLEPERMMIINLDGDIKLLKSVK